MTDRQFMGATDTNRLTHAEEYALYLNDRTTWARYVAPSWKRMLEAASPEGKRELWALAGEELRGALNEMKRNQAA